MIEYNNGQYLVLVNIKNNLYPLNYTQNVPRICTGWAGHVVKYTFLGTTSQLGSKQISSKMGKIAHNQENITLVNNSWAPICQ